MTDKNSNDSRRKLLKTIAAGSGAVIAGKAMPESWSKPVIDCVILPTHANTSEPEITTTPAACTDTLTIPDYTLDCSYTGLGRPERVLQYYVDDSGPCPVIVLGDPDPEAASIDIDISRAQDRISVTLNLGDGNGWFATARNDCPDGDGSVNNPAPGYGSVVSVPGGDTWQVRATPVAVDGSGEASITNITVTKV